MQDFTKLTADGAYAVISTQGRTKREKTIQNLLYKKGKRPASLAEQLKLLEMFFNDDGLAQFERTYSLVAAAHKASEILDKDALARFLPKLETCFDWACTLPMRKQLRKDGLHMRFSILNVLVNASVMLGLDTRYTYADQAFTALAEVNPRKTTHYTFNSTTNILNTVGVALLIRPEAFGGTARLLRGLLFHSLRMKFAGDLPSVLLRIGVPATLSEVEPPSNFIKFEESFRKFLAIKRAADAASDQEKNTLYWLIAEECVGQHTAEQKAAHLESVRRILAPGWALEGPCTD
ncbi:hypothetical protein P775_18440 [Puniceibacterium antarcticum]|uniref:Uncharacterized protein n=1 Tax=Puniceibacterium antarcticum TaxID=1206336 RepID=A0A2G8RAJ2_9RHOB|nr:hypothetical protein [Puniceibacterium antarcticum]PIL18554.1 hypothetical protein P775_18440 [Puniceibacterium antarcticum]